MKTLKSNIYNVRSWTYEWQLDNIDLEMLDYSIRQISFWFTKPHV